MKNVIKIGFLLGLVFSISACGIFKPGCQCPKFNQQSLSKR